MANSVVTSLALPEWQLLEFDRCRWFDADIVRYPRRAGVRGNFLAYLKERRLVYPDRTRQLRGRALDRPHADDVPCFRRIVLAKLEKNARKLELTPRPDAKTLGRKHWGRVFILHYVSRMKTRPLFL